MFTVYILRTSKNTLYVGQTNNIENRLKQHAAHGRNMAKYLRPFTDFKLVYTETYLTRSEAMKREWQLKQLTHAQKEILIRDN